MNRRHDNQSSNPVFHVPAHKNVSFPAAQLPIELVDAVSNCEVDLSEREALDAEDRAFTEFLRQRGPGLLPEDSVDRADAYYSRQLGF